MLQAMSRGISFKPAVVCAFLLGSVSLWPAECLESVAAVRALTPLELAAGRPVRLSGVVTYLREAVDGVNFTLDDGTGGVMVFPTSKPMLRPGQRVLVEGTTQKSRLLFSILPTRIVAGEMEQLPKPLTATLEEVLSGKFDGRFVEMEEIIRVVRVEGPMLKPQRLAFDLGGRTRRVNAWVSRWEGFEEPYIPGARVRLRGVVIRWHNDSSQPVSTGVLVNAPADAEVLPQPRVQASQSLADVIWSKASEQETPLVTSGIVTYYQLGELLFVEHEGAAIRIKPVPPEALNAGQSMSPFQPGDRVEIAGFPAIGDYTAELEDAWIRVLDSPGLPAAKSFKDAAELLSGKDVGGQDARRVSVGGMLLDVRQRDGRWALDLTSAGREFTAWFPAEAGLPSYVRAGAILRVSGICTLLVSDEARRFGRPPQTFSLLLTGAQDLELQRPAPWWTPSRRLVALGSLAGAGLLAALWALVLRKKNALLRLEIEARERAEERLSWDRRRVASDLHDTLEQTLIAASLQLSAAAWQQPTLVGSSPTPLSLAQQLLTRGQQEVRDAVWDLHMEINQPQLLSTLLTCACSEAGALTKAEIVCKVLGEEFALPGLLLAQSVRLVREAVTNALKHARPQRVCVTCDFSDSWLRLTIADDGVGFDSKVVIGPESGHFGLTGMKERIQRLQGELTVQSRPGHGTSIVAVLPIRGK